MSKQNNSVHNEVCAILKNSKLHLGLVLGIA